jgi:hypothetical protein
VVSDAIHLDLNGLPDLPEKPLNSYLAAACLNLLKLQLSSN